MQINTSCPLFAFITATVAMLITAIKAIIPSTVVIILLNSFYDFEITRKNVVTVFVIVTFIISLIPTPKTSKIPENINVKIMR